MVWYYHLFKNFPQFVVIHTVKGFSVVNKTEIEVFLWTSLVAQTVKRLPIMWGDPGSIPGSGRSPGEGNGNPLQ